MLPLKNHSHWLNCKVKDNGSFEKSFPDSSYGVLTSFPLSSLKVVICLKVHLMVALFKQNNCIVYFTLML